MKNLIPLIIIYIFINSIFGIVCLNIAKKKELSSIKWFILGFIFGWITLVYLYYIPDEGIDT